MHSCVSAASKGRRVGVMFRHGSVSDASVFATWHSHYPESGPSSRPTLCHPEPKARDLLSSSAITPLMSSRRMPGSSSRLRVRVAKSMRIHLFDCISAFLSEIAREVCPRKMFTRYRNGCFRPKADLTSRGRRELHRIAPCLHAPASATGQRRIANRAARPAIGRRRGRRSAYRPSPRR